MTNLKPNILFILSDQHNAKFLSHKKHPDVKTPNLDRLAKEGVSFNNTITQSPVCTPSRISWLSGQYCHNHRYYGLSGPNPQGLPTILGHFKKAGYESGYFGKSHCPENWIEADCDVFHDTTGNNVNGPDASYISYLNKKQLAELEDQAIMREFGERGRQSVDARPSKLTFSDSQEGWIVQQSINYMKQCKEKNKPFFTIVSFPKPHQCYTPAQEFWDLYHDESITLPFNSDYPMKNKAPHLTNKAEYWKNSPWQLFEPKTFHAGRLRKLHGYLGSISHIDHAIGKLLEWLDINNIADNTIVIYSSDHGEYACEHGIMEKSPGICSDAVTRIPMIWRWSSHFKAGYVANEIVEAIDLGNTLSVLTNIEAMETSDGIDYSHMLYGKTQKIHDIGVTELPWSKSVRYGNYRYIYYPKKQFEEIYPNGFGELYNLYEDPWEMHNLFFDSKYKAFVNELKSELFDWLILTSRPATVLPSAMKITSQSELFYNNSVNKDGLINYRYIQAMKNKDYI